MRVAFANMKGGVGKTTLAFMLAASYRVVEKSARVLVVDLDPQAHLTHRLTLDEEVSPEKSVAAFFDGKVSLKDCVRPTQFEWADLIPSHIVLGFVEHKLMQRPLEVLKLKNALDELEGYDLVVIDCPPSLGVFSTAGVVAADVVVCPITPDSLAVEGLKYLTEWLGAISNMPQVGPKRSVIVINLVDKRYASHKVFVEIARKEYNAALAISRRVIYQRAIDHKVSPWKEAITGREDAIREIKEFIKVITGVRS